MVSAAAEEGEWLACQGGRFSGSPDFSRRLVPQGDDPQGHHVLVLPRKARLPVASALRSPSVTSLETAKLQLDAFRRIVLLVVRAFMALALAAGVGVGLLTLRARARRRGHA